MTEALKRVSLLVEKSRRIYLELSAGQMQIRSEESEIGVAREDIPVEFEGPETTVALNYTYLWIRCGLLRVIRFRFTSPKPTRRSRSIRNRENGIFIS